MRVLSSFDDYPGTLISSKNFDKRLKMENRLITAITSNKNIIQIEITCASNSFLEVIKKFTEESLIVDKVELRDTNKIVLIASLADKNKFESMLNSLKNLKYLLTEK